VLRAIRSVNQLIIRERDRDRLLQGACDRLIETCGYDNAWIALMDETGALVTATGASSDKEFLPILERLKRGELPDCAQQALSQSEVVVTDGLSLPLTVDYGGGGVMTVRLEYGEKVYGLLSTSVSADFAMIEEEHALFREVAGDIAFALYSIELEEKRKRAEGELRASEQRYRLLFERNLAGVYRTTLDGRILDCNESYARIFGYDSREEILALRASEFYFDAADRGKFITQLQERGTLTNSEWCLRRKDDSPVWVLENSSLIEGEEGTPTYIQGTLVAITERKRAEEALRQSHTQLQRTLEGTVNVLVSAIEMRDPYTAGHQRRVTQLTCAIAEEMDLSQERIEGLRMAGLIHDIGKITVPAEILSKPSQLTELEFGLIKMHPQIGYDVLKEMDFPWPVAQIVLQHHERMDGSGYPQGLSGEDILLEARILGVADVVEAMASHRPYRPALGVDKALEEISQNRGVLYDPEVVDACLKLFTEKKYKFE
jgi:PAS domain S-box-containing protein